MNLGTVGLIDAPARAHRAAHAVHLHGSMQARGVATARGLMRSRRLAPGESRSCGAQQARIGRIPSQGMWLPAALALLCVQDAAAAPISASETVSLDHACGPAPPPP
eukprot:COSAG03_NODE_16368_length_404_cov_0.531148_1_plen_106_part_01